MHLSHQNSHRNLPSGAERASRILVAMPRTLRAKSLAKRKILTPLNNNQKPEEH